MLDYSLPIQIQKGCIGCIEEFIILAETNDLLKYSLSNNLDDMKMIIFEKTGKNIYLDKASWKINPELSISVKHLMNKYRMNLSMTILEIDKKIENRTLVVNMRCGDKWFSTFFEELGNDFVCREKLNVMRYISRLLEQDKNYDDSDE